MFLRGFAALALFAVSLTAVHAATLVYPNAKDAMFLIDIPADWTGEPAEEEGGFMNLEGPSGILVSLRTVQTSEYSMDDVVKEASDFINENYQKVEWTPVGKDGDMWTQGGAGKNEGTDTIFAHVFVNNKADGVIFEMRMATDYSDDAGVEQGKAIIKTIRSAK